MTSSNQPRNRILRNIDDMGAFRAEYSPNATYWFQVISGRICGCCVFVMSVLLMPSYCYWGLIEAEKANPGEIPGYFYPVVWGMMIGFPTVMLFVFLFIFCSRRKAPLVFGLFEKGIVIVRRNKTHRRVFWNDVQRIRVKTQGKKKPRILAFAMEILSPGLPSGHCVERIPMQYFRKDEELCQHIRDSTPHAEKLESPFITKQQRRRMLVAILIFIPVTVWIQVYLGPYIRSRSSVSTKWQIESQMTGETMHFAVYLPPGYHYDQSGRKYPVLYLLHGFRDDHTGWLQHGELRRIADETIRNGKAVPMVIIMPHTLGGFYGNGFDGRNRYEDYFFTELIPFVEKHFRVHTDKEHRAIAGISMGGQGAFYYAMKYPEMFAACCPMGGAFNFTDLNSVQMGREISEVDGNTNDLGVLLQWTAERQQLADPDESQNTFVRFYFDCGEQDGLIKINRDLNAKMQELDIPHEFRTHPGGHDWRCWQDALPEVLEFVSVTFAK